MKKKIKSDIKDKMIKRGIMDKEHKTGRLNNFFTNNGRYDETHGSYRRVYLLNAILLVMPVVCLFFTVVDIIIFKIYIIAFINAVSALLAVLTLAYFKKTDNYKPTAYFAIAILILALSTFFYLTENKHFSFVWLAIIPPILYFLLGNKKGSIILLLYGICIMLFILLRKNSWEPAEFNTEAIFNIAGSVFTLTALIAYFEKSRKDAWNAFKMTNTLLKNSKNELKTILDTAGEGIFGIGADEKCIFCNSRSIEILGYNDEKELIGKDMYGLVYGKKKDGAITDRENSTIYKTITTGEKVNAEDEVFWRADDSYFEVEFFSYPMYKDDMITGAVVTFLDISERKRNEEKLQYINQHDALTGLINRQRFEIEMQNYDKEEYLPLSIIYSDLNGLKLANDVFGHEAGDKLIRTAADILISASRKNDIVARIGGDEFVWLLPNTDVESADKIIERVKKSLNSNDANVVKCSMAMGSSAKISMEEDIEQTFKDAEYEMYQEKSVQREKYEDDTLHELMGKLNEISPYQETHSQNVSLLCEMMGQAMKWPKDRTRTLKDSGYYHDIGKIVLAKELINKIGRLTPLESMEIQQHPVVGFRLMNVFSDTLDLGDSIYYHHERWDGSGYPKGLKGEEIPINSRIIAIAEQYDHFVNPHKEGFLAHEEALNKIKEMAGEKLDPKLVEMFININRKSRGKK